ncbi:hypothetical protein BDZ91DRAFT_788450 [Kalaharituber pfeilii]|nr:hypothetical protein BDZ91DRAFT_788450 [Kalaharituber pfeilii]
MTLPIFFRRDRSRERPISGSASESQSPSPSQPSLASSQLLPTYEDEKQRLKSTLRESDVNPLSPKTPHLYSSTGSGRKNHTGTKLITRHAQSYLAITWLAVLVVYVCLMEYAVYAHKLSPDLTKDETDVITFGKQGTPWRSAVVQWFSVARTILAVAHVPIVTGTLASTLPPLTQSFEGRMAPRLTASQLFILADRSWAGAGGWYNALRIGNLPWAWWKLTILTMAAFIGFPLMTLAYKTDSQQFWEPNRYEGVSGWRVPGGAQTFIQALQPTIFMWMHSKPQRNLGNSQIVTIPMEDNLAFYPPANALSPLGHFVSRAPGSSDGLVVTNTLGFLQTLRCQRVPAGGQTKLLEFSGTEWGCRVNCTEEQSKELCHARTSTGKMNGIHATQVVSCAKENPATTAQQGVTVNVEVAMKLNPDYKRAGLEPPFPQGQPKPFSFRERNELSGDEYYVEVVSCTMGYVPGHAVVDSVIRKFMHFVPLRRKGDPGFDTDLEGFGLTPAEEERLWRELGSLLNVTTALPIKSLHEAFLESGYATDTRNFNSSLPFWFGVQKPNDPFTPITKKSSEREPLREDKYLVDNMVRVNGSIFSNALVGMANSTLIAALGTSEPVSSTVPLDGFFTRGPHPAFIYRTDVKITRGYGVPLGVAPVVLLAPIAFVVYHACECWGTPTWTEFLDAWAMFKLGRGWGGETVGLGGIELGDCWETRRIPGFVGDGRGGVGWGGGAGIEEGGEGHEEGGRGEGRYVGLIQLGGRRPLRRGVVYM